MSDLERRQEGNTAGPRAKKGHADGGWGGPVDESRPMPKLKEGQVRCPHCEHGYRPSSNGRLPLHPRTGPQCTGSGMVVLPGTVHLGDVDEVAPVNMRTAGNVGQGNRADPSRSRLDAGSSCQDCGRWLPGERRLCSACQLARQ